MKALRFLLLLFLFLKGVYAQWIVQNPLPEYKSLSSVYFPSHDTGYAVGGDSGTVIKTIDGGITWNSINSGTTNLLLDVYFFNNDTGYATGTSGTIIKTTNGGSTWIPLNSGTNNPLSSICFVDANTGFAVGGIDNNFESGGIILKTIDQGIHWYVVPCGNISKLYSVWFIDAMNGYVVGGFSDGFSWQGTILKTTDGGSTWSGLLSPFLLSVFFLNADTGYAAGWWGNVMKTTDGGITWTDVSVATSYWFNSVFFTDANTGYVVGGGGGEGLIYKTVDGGVSWTALSSGTTNNLLDVFFTNSDTGYAVGDGGIVVKTTNGGIAFIEEQLNAPLKPVLKCYPNPANECIFFYLSNVTTKEATLFIYNSSGILLKKFSAIKSFQLQIPVDDIGSDGMYFYVVRTNDQQFAAGEFIIQR